MFGTTPLLFAIANNDVKTVNQLLRSGANQNEVDSNGVTPLMYSLCLPDDAIFDVLIKKGADLEKKDHVGRSVLFRAIIEKRHQKQDKLIAAGAQFNDDMLCVAAVSANNPRMLFRCIQAGLNIHQRVEYGMTLLMIACKKGFDACAYLLISAGVDLDVEDEHGRSAVFWASCECRSFVVKLLVAAGACLINPSFVQFSKLEHFWKSNQEMREFVKFHQRLQALSCAIPSLPLDIIRHSIIVFL